MKTFIVLCMLVALAASTAVREKRGLGWAEPDWQSGFQSSGWQPDGWKSSGWHDQPKTKIIAVKKLVHVQREVTVPQVVHVRKVISEPKVIVLKKEVPVGHGRHGWW